MGLREESNAKWLLKGVGFLVISLVLSIILITYSYRWVNPSLTWLMVNRYFIGEKTYLKPIDKQWVDIDHISPKLMLAVIAAEDNLFPYHWGFDIESIKQAREYNKRGIKTRGASTISMQVAKNVFLWPSRTWVRKTFEIGFTLLIELLWTKERIMEIYLNVAELGNAVYGAESASKLYFKKSAFKLSALESALIATVLPSPLKRNPLKPSNYMIRYQQEILTKMEGIGPINLSEGRVKSPYKEKRLQKIKR